MGEGTDEENSDIPDNTSDEQTGDGEDKKAPVTEKEEEQTPADDESDEEQDVADESEAGSDEELTDENKPADEATVSDEDEEFGEINANGSSINAVAPSATEISVSYVNGDATSDTDKEGKDSDADVVYLNGCVDSSGKLATGRELRFRVGPGEGRYVEKVELQLGETAAKPLSATSGIYSEGNASFTTGTGENAAAVNGKIIITTKAVTYAVTPTASTDENQVANSYKIYEVTKAEGATAESVGSDEVTGAQTIKYGESKKFAIELTADAGKAPVNKLVGVTIGEDEIEYKEEPFGTGEAAKKYQTFTVEPAKIPSLKDEHKNTAVACDMEIKVVAKVDLTVADPADASAGYTVSASDTNKGETYINYDGTKKFGDPIIESSEDLKKSLAFKVEPKPSYKITSVTASVKAIDADAGVAGTPVTVAPATAPAAGGEFTIALNQAGLNDFAVDSTLTIEVKAELDKTKDGVHTITLTGMDHVKVTNDNKEIKDGEVITSENEYKIKVTPDAGYELAKGTKTTGDDKNDDQFVVTVKETRTYPETAEGKNDAVSGRVVTREEEAYKDGAAQEITLKFKGDDLKDKNYKDNPADTDSERAYTVTSVEVVIAASIIGNEQERIAHITAAKGLTYEITDSKIINDEEAEAGKEKDTWVIPEGVNELKFAVKADTEPIVKLAADDGDITFAATAGEGTFAYAIPAAALPNDGTAGEITISAGNVIVEKKNVLMKIDEDDVAVSNEEGAVSFDGEKNAEGFYVLEEAAIVGEELSYTFQANEGAKINSVTYEMGETKGAARRKVNAEYGDVTYELSIAKVTGDVKITVDSVSDYEVILSSEDENTSLKGENGKYTADYTEKNILIELKKLGTATNIYNVVVKDPQGLAETFATVDTDNQFATIGSIAEEDRGETLTIEVYTDKTHHYDAELAVSAAADEKNVTITLDGKPVKDNKASLMADSALTFKVETKGSANYADLAVEVLSVKENATAQDNTAAAALLEAPVFNREDGSLKIQAKPAKEAPGSVIINIKNTNVKEKDKDGKDTTTDKSVAKLTVNITDPLVKLSGKDALISKVTAVAGSATNRSVSLNVNVEFKNKKNPPAAPLTGDLYYKVEIEKPTTEDKDVTLIADTGLVQYVKVGKDEFGNPAKTVTFDLATVYAGDTQALLKDIPVAIATKAKVTLVQSVVGTPTKDDDYVTGAEAAMKDNTLSTKIPVYETKLGVKAVNGAAVFTGQNDVKVATPVFTKLTSFDSLTVQFVDTKMGALIGTASTGTGKSNAAKDAVSGEDFRAYVGADNAIYVTSTDAETKAADYKTLGVKVTAAGTNESYCASAIVKLNIKQGIYSIVADESKTALPTRLYKDSDPRRTKAVSFKIATTLNEGAKEKKPASAKLEWSVVPTSESASAYAKAAVQGKKPLVSVKNGTVTVSKDYVVQNMPLDNYFTVIARAVDYADNATTMTKADEMSEVTFEITNEKAEIDRLVIVDTDEKAYDPASLTAEDVWVDNYEESGAALTVKALDKDGNVVEATFKSGNAKSLAVDTVTGELTLIKPANNIKITANTVDGGKAKAKDVKVNIAPFKTIGLFIEDVNSTEEKGLDNKTIEYTGNANKLYRLSAAVKDKNGTWSSAYTGLKVTVKDGKFTADKDYAKNGGYMGSAVVVTGKKDEAAITVTDTANKDKNTNTAVYTIKNKGFKDAKAPSIKLDSVYTYDAKKEKYVYAKKVDGNTESITWKVTDAKATPANYVGKYVKLEADNTAAKNAADNWDAIGSGVILKIDEQGLFTLDTESGISTGGKYSLIATVGDVTGGEFVPLVKDVKLNFSIPNAKKPNKNLTVGANYTLDTKSRRNAQISVKTDLEYSVEGPMNVMLKDKDQGADKHTNNFTTYFNVWSSDDNWYIGLNDNLTAEQIATISSKDAKADCEGYITVIGYDDYEEVIRKDVKVKINFKESKYTLTNAAVFSNEQSKTPISAYAQVKEGKNNAYVAAWKVAEDDGFGAVDTVQEVNGSSWLTISSKPSTTVAAKKYKMTIKAVPADSPFVKWDVTQQKYVCINDKAEGGKALTMADLLADDNKCVTMTTTIDVKAAEVKGAVKKVNKNVTLDAWDYTRNKIWLDDDNYDGIAQGSYGFYEEWVGLEMAGDGTEGYVKAVEVNLKDKDGADLNKIKVSDSKTVDLVTVQKYDSGFGVRVSKEALIALSDEVIKDKKAKVITNYGKKLTVPVKVTYNGLAGEDEIKLNIAMPKNRPASFEDVQKRISDATAQIESIQTKLAREIYSNFGNTAEKKILVRLFVDVQRAVWARIPADSDVDLAYQTSTAAQGSNSDEPCAAVIDNGTDVAADAAAGTPDWNAILSGGKARINLDLRDLSKADGEGNPAKIHFTFNDLGLDTKDADITTVSSAISNVANTLSFTNETTRETLLAEIREKLAADDETKALVDPRKGHIRLSIGEGEANFKVTPATTKENGDGKVEATITIKDVLNDSTSTAKITGKINKMNSLTDAADAVNELFQDGGSQSNDKVLAYVNNWSGQGELIKTAIKKAAEDALNNKLITVDYAADTTAAKGWDYVAPTPASGEGDSAVEAKDGHIAFTLVITKKQDVGEGTRSRKVTVTEVPIPKENAAKYLVLVDAKKKVSDAVTGDALQKLFTGEGKTFTNTEEDVKSAILTAAGTGTGALKDYEGFKVAYAEKNGKADFDFTPASKETNATIAFTLEVSYEGATAQDGKETVSVTKTELKDTKADKYQNVDELIAEIRKFNKVTIATGGSIPADQAAAISSAQTEIEKLKEATATALNDVTITAAASTDPATVYTKGAGDTPTTATLTNLKVTVKEGSDADAKTTDIPISTITFEVQAGA